jgi:hypothetical protein
MKIEIPTRALRAAVIAAPKQDVRNYLTGVFVEIRPEQTIVVGTNGHWLFAARHCHEDCQGSEDLIIPRDTVETALKGNKDETLLLARLDGDEWRLGALIFKPIDGTYPDWRRVVPETVSNENADFSPKYIAETSRALSIWNRVSPSSYVSGYLLYPNGLSGAVATGPDPDGFCVLMPQRRPDGRPEKPDLSWTSQPKAKRKLKAV